MNEDFAYVAKKLGPQLQTVHPDQGLISQYQAKLPSGLIEYWQEYGIGSWAGGKFQFCNPADYASTVALILRGDPDYSLEHTHLIGYGAFGDLVLWHETRQCLHVNLPYLRATADAVRPNWKATEANIALTSRLYGLADKESFTLFDNAARAAPIYERCAKRLGPPDLGECYGLHPALALGGSTDITSVKRVRAREHFALLAQLGPIRLVNYDSLREVFVRNLGSQG